MATSISIANSGADELARVQRKFASVFQEKKTTSADDLASGLGACRVDDSLPSSTFV